MLSIMNTTLYVFVISTKESCIQSVTDAFKGKRYRVKHAPSPISSHFLKEGSVPETLTIKVLAVASPDAIPVDCKVAVCFVDLSDEALDIDGLLAATFQHYPAVECCLMSDYSAAQYARIPTHLLNTYGKKVSYCALEQLHEEHKDLASELIDSWVATEKAARLRKKLTTLSEKMGNTAS